MKLKELFDASDKEYIEGSEVEEYLYPPGVGFDGEVTVTLANDEMYTFDQQQEVSLGTGGATYLTTTEGQQVLAVFLRTIPLTPDFFD